MTASIRFEDALKYPFREANRARLVWMPGSVLFVLHFISFLVGIGAIIYLYVTTGEIDEESASYKLVDVATRLLDAVIGFFVSLPLMGYLWKMMGRLRTDGDAATPPAWVGEESDGGLLRYTLDGLKLMLYYIPASIISMLPALVTIVVIAIFVAGGYDVLNSLQAGGYAVAVLLVLISIFTMLAFGFFMAPFLFAPVVLSAHTRKLGDLFNLFRAWGEARRHYATGLKATGLMIAAGMLYAVAGVGLLCTCIGIMLLPFLQFPYWLILAYLAVQVFPPEESEPSAG